MTVVPSFILTMRFFSIVFLTLVCVSLAIEIKNVDMELREAVECAWCVPTDHRSIGYMCSDEVSELSKAH